MNKYFTIFLKLTYSAQIQSNYRSNGLQGAFVRPFQPPKSSSSEQWRHSQDGTQSQSFSHVEENIALYYSVDKCSEEINSLLLLRDKYTNLLTESVSIIEKIADSGCTSYCSTDRESFLSSLILQSFINFQITKDEFKQSKKNISRSELITHFYYTGINCMSSKISEVDTGYKNLLDGLYEKLLKEYKQNRICIFQSVRPCEYVEKLVDYTQNRICIFQSVHPCEYVEKLVDYTDIDNEVKICNKKFNHIEHIFQQNSKLLRLKNFCKFYRKEPLVASSFDKYAQHVNNRIHNHYDSLNKMYLDLKVAAKDEFNSFLETLWRFVRHKRKNQATIYFLDLSLWRNTEDNLNTLYNSYSRFLQLVLDYEQIIKEYSDKVERYLYEFNLPKTEQENLHSLFNPYEYFLQLVLDYEKIIHKYCNKVDTYIIKVNLESEKESLDSSFGSYTRFRKLVRDFEKNMHDEKIMHEKKTMGEYICKVKIYFINIDYIQKNRASDSTNSTLTYDVLNFLTSNACEDEYTSKKIHKLHRSNDDNYHRKIVNSIESFAYRNICALNQLSVILTHYKNCFGSLNQKNALYVFLNTKAILILSHLGPIGSVIKEFDFERLKMNLQTVQSYLGDIYLDDINIRLENPDYLDDINIDLENFGICTKKNILDRAEDEYSEIVVRKNNIITINSYYNSIYLGNMI